MTDNNPPKAVVPPPPPRSARRGILAAVPDTKVQPPPSNMQKVNSGFQDMNFKVEPEFHQAFKVVAAVRGMAMKDLLEACFAAWVNAFGDDQIRAITSSLPKGEKP